MSEIGDLVLIKKLESPKYNLISLNKQEVRTIGELIGKDLTEYDGALVEIGDGDYSEVWVFNGGPYIDKMAERVY